MIHHFFYLLLLTTTAVAQACDSSLACMDVADCATFGASIPCDRANPTDPLGCCTVPATTAAPPVTAPSAGTTASACVDLLNPVTGVSDCPVRANLCTNSVYLAVMQQQCPRTCGFCDGSAGGSTTRKTSKAYCNNTVYQSLMKVQCPATCGFC